MIIHIANIYVLFGDIMLQSRLFLKCMMLVFLLICFAFTLVLVRYIVHEREDYQKDVIEQIEKHQISTQYMVSPMIRVPYMVQLPCDENKEDKSNAKLCTYEKQHLIFPSQSEWNADFNVSNQQYQRGIYRATSYQAQISAKMGFNMEQLPQLNYDWSKAKFIFPVADLRGIQQKPVLTMGGQKYTLEFAQFQQKNAGLTALELDLNSSHWQNLKQNVELNLQLDGLKSFAFIPNHEHHIFNAKGNWSDAKYAGENLPQQNTSTEQGFSAMWKNLNLGNYYQEQLKSCFNDHQCSHSILPEKGFYVEFIEPINIYSQTDRATKYGWLITMMTFGCFFLFEVLKGLRIHPIQYLLVGVAQSVFFVLLLSVSEQFSYLVAYYTASIACIGLISWYLMYVLKGWKNVVLFSVLLSGLYMVMYVLLQSSEKTFFMGSIFAFILVAVVMFITRHVDWYAIGEKQ